MIRFRNAEPPFSKYPPIGQDENTRDQPHKNKDKNGDQPNIKDQPHKKDRKEILPNILSNGVPSLEMDGQTIETFQTWREVSRRWKDSVLQLRVTRGIFNIRRPYQTPRDRKSSGTGFIIDIHRGLVVTNAHVVKDAFSITARTPRLGSRDIFIKLYSISIERDLALCQLSIDGINMITQGLNDSNSLNIKFADDLLTHETQEVLTIGFPLGDEVKFTTGVISGFHRENNDNGDEYLEDALSRDPTYIQITAAINPGNSGGPLFNREGRVIGVNAAGYLFAQNTGYAIRSRIFLSLLPTLLRQEGIAPFPTWSLAWSPLNSAFFEATINGKSDNNVNESCPSELKISNKDFEKKGLGETFEKGGLKGNLKENPDENGLTGIYLRKIYPDSILATSEKPEIPEGELISTVEGRPVSPLFNLEKSVLLSVIYQDPFLLGSEAFDPTKYQIENHPLQVKDDSNYVFLEIDSHGMVALYKMGTGQTQQNEANGQSDTIRSGERLSDRLFDISEMVDLLPIPSVLTLQIYTPINEESKEKNKEKTHNNHQKKTRPSKINKCPFSLIRIPYQPRNIYRLPKAQPIIEPFDYEILAGMCLMELLADHSQTNFQLDCRYSKPKNRYQPALIICQIFPGTEASQTNSFQQMDLLKTFQGRKAKTLKDLRQIISSAKNESFLRFTNQKDSVLVVSKNGAQKEDVQILETFQILPRYHSLSGNSNGNLVVKNF